jgi:hypothetical protein
MKTIIRIEYFDGNGLWQSVDNDGNIVYRTFSFKLDLIRKHDKFPTPQQEGLIINDDDYCAFKSIDQLNQWIDKEWFNEIINKGFKILMIDVSKCIEGDYQILYKKEDILQTKDISSLFIN